MWCLGLLSQGFPLPSSRVPQEVGYSASLLPLWPWSVPMAVLMKPGRISGPPGPSATAWCMSRAQVRTVGKTGLGES